MVASLVPVVSGFRACEEITLNAETAETAQKNPRNSRRALRALCQNVVFSQALQPDPLSTSFHRIRERCQAADDWRILGPMRRILAVAAAVVVIAGLVIVGDCDRSG